MRDLAVAPETAFETFALGFPDTVFDLALALVLALVLGCDLIGPESRVQLRNGTQIHPREGRHLTWTEIVPGSAAHVSVFACEGEIAVHARWTIHYVGRGTEVLITASFHLVENENN